MVFYLAGHGAGVGRSANHAAGNGVPRVPHGRTLDRSTKTRRVLNTGVARAPLADLREITRKTGALGDNEDFFF